MWQTWQADLNFLWFARQDARVCKCSFSFILEWTIRETSASFSVSKIIDKHGKMFQKFVKIVLKNTHRLYLIFLIIKIIKFSKIQIYNKILLSIQFKSILYSLHFRSIIYSLYFIHILHSLSFRSILNSYFLRNSLCFHYYF